MKNITLALSLIVVLVAAVAFVIFGTLSPCEALKKEMLSYALRSTINKTSPKNDLEWAGMGLGMMIGGSMIDNVLDSFTPMECTRMLVKHYKEGKGKRLSAYLDK